MNDGDLRPIETVLSEAFPDRILVYEVEDGRLWFSGMNANLGGLLTRARRVLSEEGYTVGPPLDDGVHAMDNGGMVLPVREAGGDEWDCEAVEEFRMSFEDDPETWEQIRDGRLHGFEIDGATDEEVREAVREVENDERTTLPIEVDPERLNTGGASTSPSTFEERARRGESRLDRVRRFLRGLIP